MDLPEKKKRKRPDTTVQASPAENTKYLNHNLELYDLPKIDHYDLEQVSKRVREYFGICAKNGMKPTVAGFALSFGVDRKTMYCWVNGIDSKRVPDEVRNTLKIAYCSINAQMEDYMMNGKINPVAGIFLMKNNMGYTDTQNIEVAPKQPLGSVESQKALEERYIDSSIVETK